MDEEENGISGKLLDKAQAELREFIEKNNTPKGTKMILEMQGYILMIIANDHKRTNAMYKDHAKRQKQKMWWEKFQWVIIPMVTASVIAFFGQAVVFWFDIYPKLSQLP